MPANPLTKEQLAEAARLKKIFVEWQAKQKHAELAYSQEAAAGILGFGQSAFSQYLNGRIPLNIDAAKKISDLLGCHISDFSESLAKEVAKFAPTMSEASTFSERTVGPGPDIRGQVPLISWVAAGAFCESPDNFAPGDAEKWLSCPIPHGKYTYCLRVVGKSMDNGDDGYRDGEIIFVDPDVEAMPGRDAIVRTPNGESTFKRLKQDVDGLYLQALNPRWEPNYFKMPEGSHICGIVIFAGRER